MQKLIVLWLWALLVVGGLSGVALGAMAIHHSNETVSAVRFGWDQIVHSEKTLPESTAVSDSEWQAQEHAKNMKRAEVLRAQAEQFALSFVNQQALAKSSAHVSDDEDGLGEHPIDGQLARLGLTRP